MNIDKKFSVCFSGYQPEEFPFDYCNNELQRLKLEKQIEQSIVKALNLGYRWFFCGMTKGFDLLSAEILLDIREQCKQYRNIRLISVLPYVNHNYKDKWHELYNCVKTCADQIVIISPEYRTDCHKLCNQYMIDHSNYLICYWDGKDCETAQTIKMAKNRGLFIDNIAHR